MGDDGDGVEEVRLGVSGQDVKLRGDGMMEMPSLVYSAPFIDMQVLPPASEAALLSESRSSYSC